MSQKKLLNKWAEILCIREASVIRKSRELYRLLKLKPNLCISANDECIICLDIAAEMLGSNFDSHNGLSRSNLTMLQYLSQRRNIVRLLDLKKTPRCAEICMQLQINKQVGTQAASLLGQYRAQSLNHQTDFSHPQYVCMAIYMSLKMPEQTKIRRKQLLAKSTLKSAQWSKLQNIWSVWMKKNEAILNDRPVTAVAELITTDVPTDQMELKVVVPESYEAWQERMLTKAYAELEELRKRGL